MPKNFSTGDIFAVPLPNGEFAFGQVIAREREALNSVGCAFFSEVRSAAAAVPQSLTPIAVLLVTPDLLNRGRWPVIGKSGLVVPIEWRPYEQFRELRWVGAKVSGSGIVEKFLAAYSGLLPWDDWFIPDYLDKLLLPGVERPQGVVLVANG